MAAAATWGDVARTGDQGIDALISPWRWNAATLTYSFPLSGATYGYGPEKLTVAPFNDVQAAVVSKALREAASFTKLNFLKITESVSKRADLRFAESDDPATAHAYLPGGEWGGDAWFNKLDFDAPDLGNYAHHTIYHEIGHALGLKHGHEAEHYGRLPRALDSLEFSIMTYRSYVGGIIDYATYAEGHGPQSYMMLDIAALQEMYGADFGFRSGATVYRFDKATGEMLVNGASTGTPEVNVIFRTIWDGGGVDTFDLRNYTTSLRIDLAPGAWSTFASAQRAHLGDGHLARGNVANALLYDDDPRSLIENATGGSGSDVIRGNAADNRLAGGQGSDKLFGKEGNDRLLGGSGSDTLTGGDGDDVLQGGDGADRMAGGNGDDWLLGGYGNDILLDAPGTDILNGGLGADTAVFANAAAAYALSTLDGVTTIVELATGVSDMLIGIESVQFSDGLVPI